VQHDEAALPTLMQEVHSQEHKIRLAAEHEPELKPHIGLK
jgi:hypothetical protein